MSMTVFLQVCFLLVVHALSTTPSIVRTTITTDNTAEGDCRSRQ